MSVFSGAETLFHQHQSHEGVNKWLHLTAATVFTRICARCG